MAEERVVTQTETSEDGTTTKTTWWMHGFTAVQKFFIQAGPVGLFCVLSSLVIVGGFWWMSGHIAALDDAARDERQAAMALLLDTVGKLNAAHREDMREMRADHKAELAARREEESRTRESWWRSIRELKEQIAILNLNLLLKGK